MQVYTLPDGRVLRRGDQFRLNGQLYPSNWLELADEADLLALEIEVSTEDDPPAPEPTNSRQAYGVVRFAVVGGVASTSVDSVKAAAVLRVSAGRYRIYPADPDPDRRLLANIVLFDTAERKWRISARTTAYIEVRVTDAAGVAADAAEVTMYLDRVISS